jgi:hypothetical protein
MARLDFLEEDNMCILEAFLIIRMVEKRPS